MVSLPPYFFRALKHRMACHEGGRSGKDNDQMNIW
jgi:hypothetical protein